MKNKRVFSGVLLAVIGELFMLSIVGCDNATTPTTTTQYTVTFDANGGTVSPETAPVEEGKTLSSLPTPEKTSGGDTVFQGWYTKNGTDNDDWGAPFKGLTPITTDITVYAKWGSAPPTKHTVTFNPDGGAVTPTSDQINSGDPVGSLPEPTKDNHTFGGWWTMQNGGGAQFIETTIVDDDITVYAKWTAIIDDENNFAGAWSASIPEINSGEIATLEIGATTWELKDRMLKGTYVRTGNNATMTITEVFANSEWRPTEQFPEEDFPSIRRIFTVSVSNNILTATNLVDSGPVTFTKTNSDPKKVSVTGLSDYNGKRIEVALTETQNPTSIDDVIAFYSDRFGPVIANGERRELPLYIDTDQSQPWTGSGSYYVEIIIRTPDSTNHNETDFVSKNKIAFVSTTTTVEFSLEDFNIDEPADPATKLEGTWKKGNITLVIEASQLTISGANWGEINKTFQIERIRQNSDGTIGYNFSSYGINCKLQNENLIILEGSGPDELHGTWTRINNTNNNSDEFPGNWKTLDYAGWQTWFDNLDMENMTQETREIIHQSLKQHFSEMTDDGRSFWEDLMSGSNETPEDYRGTWKKGSITLVFEASQLTISGANWNDINTTFQIERIRHNFDGSIQYYFPPYGIDCRLQNDNLIILEGSGPDELHGTWTSH